MKKKLTHALSKNLGVGFQTTTIELYKKAVKALSEATTTDNKNKRF